MAITNHQRVGQALNLLKDGLAPFVDREVMSAAKEGLVPKDILHRYAEDPNLADKTIKEWDVAPLMRLMNESWNTVFKKTLGYAERSILSELRDWRNKWAHQATITSDDADRVLDSVFRFLNAIDAPKEAAEAQRMKQELRRLIYEEQVRGEKRKSSKSLIEGAATGTLKPWREVITPHPDVASGRYQQAEFAADLWQVHLGEGTDEYRKPKEFFRRTFLTESLKKLLIGAVSRLTGEGGDPIVQLQTNFGGGKTHSMLALYHLFSGTSASELQGVEEVLAEAGVEALPKVRRLVLVGNKISPGNPSVKPDGTEVKTLWGEMAYQIGGKEAYDKIRADDEKATSPGDKLRELFNEYGPCLILIDEWVAYARQLHDQSDLPGGSFETQFSFAQVLTESAKLAKNCLLVISLPASDTTGSSHAQADDVEVGGVRGREALDRLRNVVGRIESSWRPASAEEGFEIVRRRLFQTIPTESFKYRDVTAKAFAELYQNQRAEFPPETLASDYETRIKAAYPIHPEIFDRLYNDWSTLVKFQRTRGVLRLMSSVIHSLWEKGDRNPIILPSTVPIDDARVQFELTRYLSDQWPPIIERDVDGPNSTPMKIDAEVSNLGQLHATRRVARTIYLGSAPLTGGAHRGIEDRRVKLGCVMPGESPAIFGDAFRRLAATATYLYQDGSRFWYSTQPTVTKMAEDRAEQLTRSPDKVMMELERLLRENLRVRGDFEGVHCTPESSADIPDDQSARLVVLSAEYPYSKDKDNAAVVAARNILESRGNSPRIFRNTLVFLAADKTTWQDLDEALRKCIAWESILDEKEELNLDPHQVRQAESQRNAAVSTVNVRIPEVYKWLLVPVQDSPQTDMEWSAIRLTGSESLAQRASKRLSREDLLLTGMGSTILRMHLDRVPLWRGNHVSIRQLLEDFARYTYLPRVVDPSVLIHAIHDGITLLTWETDTFAFAEQFDEASERYLGLRGGQSVQIHRDSTALLVKSEVARKQLEQELPPEGERPGVPGPGADGDVGPGGGEGPGGRICDPGPGLTDAAKKLPKRFYGTVSLDASRAGRDASRIAEEVISHLAGQVGSDVKVTLEIEANLPDGANEQLVRIVMENGRTLRFTSLGFEEE